MFDEKAYKAEYYKKNKERYSQYHKERYKAKGDLIRKRRRELVEKETPEHKEKRLAYHKQYNAQSDNKRKNKQRSQKPEYRYEHYYKKGAERRGIVFELSFDEFLYLHDSACSYCGDINSHGIDRVDNNIGYTLSNSVSCCTVCNHMKWGYTKELFLSQSLKIAKHNNMV